MEREIKFRAKTMDSDKWCVGMPLPSKFGCGYMLNIDAAKDADFYNSRWTMPTIGATPIDEDTIGQFTGLKDKNDKEIYEGDIVKTPMGNIGIIKFGTHEDIVHTREATRQGYNVDCFECTGWLFENIKTKEVVFMDSSVIAGDVIGNIYDNPELLKQ